MQFIYQFKLKEKMETNNAKLMTTNESLSEDKNGLQHLKSDLLEETTSGMQLKNQLMEYILEVKNANNSWLDRLSMSKEDKQLLRKHGEIQLMAAETVLLNQNKVLAAVCEGQVSFVREVVNTLLTTGRSGIKGAAAAIYRENTLALHSNLSKLSKEFADLVQEKWDDASKRPKFAQDLLMKEIDLMMAQWAIDYKRILEDFSRILNEKV